MNVQVRYYSKTGNTKKLADAIAEVANVKAETVDTPTKEEADILFLGASVYAYGIDGKVKKFISSLDPKLVKKVVVFSTSALVERGYPSIAKALKDKGIAVEEDNFYCRGKFLHLHKGHPNADDLAKAKEFAKQIIAK